MEGDRASLALHKIRSWLILEKEISWADDYAGFLSSADQLSYIFYLQKCQVLQNANEFEL